MMPISLAVGCNMNEMRSRFTIGKGLGESIGKGLTAVKQIFEGDSARDRSIVKEYIQPVARRQFNDVSIPAPLT